jgi:flagellum-specific peptidoglycan hydrolase FlgJ
MKTLFLVSFLFFSGIAGATDRGEFLKQISNKQASLFLNKIWDSCEYLSEKEKIPISISLAVAYLESRAGTTKLSRNQNNFFNFAICGVYSSYNCELDSFLDFANDIKKCHNKQQRNSIADYFYILEKCKGKKYTQKVQKIIKQFNLFLIG